MLSNFASFKNANLMSLEKVLHFHKMKQPGFCFDPVFLCRVCATICNEHIWLPLSSVVIHQFTDLKKETGHEMYFMVGILIYQYLFVAPF